MSKAHTTEATITITIDARYAQTVVLPFTNAIFPDYEDRYEAASACFDRMLEKLSKTNANLGGLVSFTEDEGIFSVIVNEDGELRTSSSSNVGGMLPA